MLALGLALLAGHAAAQPPMPPETRPCIINLTFKEGWFTATTWRSFLETTTVPRPRAYRQAVAMMSERGWYVIESDAAAAKISASPTEQSRADAVLELHVLDHGGGARVEVSFRLTGEANASRIFVQEEFCNLLEAAVSEG